MLSVKEPTQEGQKITILALKIGKTYSFKTSVTSFARFVLLIA
jgi:hypothetical protein